MPPFRPPGIPTLVLQGQRLTLQAPLPGCSELVVDNSGPLVRTFKIKGNYFPDTGALPPGI